MWGGREGRIKEGRVGRETDYSCLERGQRVLWFIVVVAVGLAMLMKTMSKITSCQSVSSLRTEISHVLSHCHQALPSIQFKPLDFYLILTVLSGC